MLNLKNKKSVGFIAAGSVAISQGMEGIFFQLFSFTILVGISSNIAFSGSVLAGKEFLGLIISVAIMGPSTFVGVFKKIKSKQGLYLTIAASLGTATGNLFFLIAIAMAGSSYGSILTAMYPIFSTILIKYMMKEKEHYLVWVGMFITVTSGMLFTLLPALVSGDTDKDWTKTIIGMLIGMVASLFWAIESLYIKKALDIKEPGTGGLYTRKEVIASRNIFATITTLFLIMPIMMIFGNSYKFLWKIASNWESLLILLTIALNIVFLRWVHIAALDILGAKLTAAIDTNNFMVPAILAEALIFLPNGYNGEPVYETIEWWSFFLVIPIAIGVMLVVYFHKESKTQTLLDPVIPLEN